MVLLFFDSSSHFFDNSLLWMEPDIEILGNEGIHAIVNHQHGAIGGVEHRQVQNSSQEILVLTKFLGVQRKRCEQDDRDRREDVETHASAQRSQSAVSGFPHDQPSPVATAHC